MTSANTFHLGGVAFRTVLFFAVNHDEELTTQDIAEKFGADAHAVPSLLQKAVHLGWLGRTKADRNGLAGAVSHVYGPGPRVLEMLLPHHVKP